MDQADCDPMGFFFFFFFFRISEESVILWYELSDQEALTLHQVKAHDVMAFAASKAFQSGVSSEQ